MTVSRRWMSALVAVLLMVAMAGCSSSGSSDKLLIYNAQHEA